MVTQTRSGSISAGYRFSHPPADGSRSTMRTISP